MKKCNFLFESILTRPFANHSVTTLMFAVASKKTHPAFLRGEQNIRNFLPLFEVYTLETEQEAHATSFREIEGIIYLHAKLQWYIRIQQRMVCIVHAYLRYRVIAICDGSNADDRFVGRF